MKIAIAAPAITIAFEQAAYASQLVPFPVRDPDDAGQGIYQNRMLV
jgi:hypothetical protein